MSLVPLESNPEVMTKFIHQLGVPKKFTLVDVYGLDPDLLAVVPRPVYALILLFPYNDKYQAYKAELIEKIEKSGQEVSPNVFHMEQSVSNACGTVALIHAVANNLDKIDLEDGMLKTYLDKAKNLSFTERGELLEDSATGIIGAHEQMAQEGQTEAPQDDQPVYHHFIALVEKDGNLYELDGRKPFPINCGPTTKDQILESATKVCAEYMARDPDDVRFTMIALVANE